MNNLTFETANVYKSGHHQSYKSDVAAVSLET